MSEPLYQPVPKIPEFPEIEQRMLRFWRQSAIFQKLRDSNRGGPHWNFQDGPITANNPMGVHHAWGRTYKDLFQRYHSMNGRDQRFMNGFDCQGLWVEVEVEKAHNFNTRKDILDFGIARFVNECKQRVLTYAAKQTEQSVRLGYWCDWDDPDTLLALRDALRDGKTQVTVTMPTGKQVAGDPEWIISQLGCAEFGGSYFTFSDENNYTIWSFLKKCHEQGYIYRGDDSMPWCCRCGTGLSQMEVGEGRRIVSHTSVFVRFPLRGREREALLVWTTTPWTLTSNVAAAVNPAMTYLRLQHGDWVYYLGKENYERERIQNLEVSGKRETHKLHTLKTILKGSGPVEILGELTGAEMVGWMYDGPFDYLPAERRPGGLNPYASGAESRDSAVDCHRVIPWEEVSGTEGTGIVHIAPGCGAEDYQLGKKYGLVAVAPLTDEGLYLEGFDWLTGRSVLRVSEEIVADIKQRGSLVARESYPHVYPHCWRCKEELVFRVVEEWFINMDWRDRIQKFVPDIRWIPAEGEAREMDWLRNMGDWMISKKRFWGLALPIWVCPDCDHFTVIGSKEELEARAVEGWEHFQGHSPHRPYIDEVKIRCQKCDGLSIRIEDVGNPWLDAGIVPFSTIFYQSDRRNWENWFPADFVVECFPGQFRNWFYSMLAMSAMLDGRAPFKTLLGHALVRDARGEEMHKSAGNAIAFDDAAEVMGAEVMRYIYASQTPVQNLNFPDLHPQDGARNTLDADVRRRLLTYWNCYSFFVTYASVDGWRPPGQPPDLASLGELDRWILSRLQRLIEAAHDSYSQYAVHHFMRHQERFCEELSNWYLRRSRRRFWKPGDDQDKQAAYWTLFTALETLSRTLAPVLPFLTEAVYQNLVRPALPNAPESIHLNEFPRIDADLIDEVLERKVDCVLRTKEQALRLRAQSKVKIRQPLERLLVRPRDDFDRQVLSDAHFAEQVLDECNVKSLELIEDEAELVEASVKPNFKALGPRYGKHMRAIGTHLESVGATALQEAFNTGRSFEFEIEGEQIEIGPEDVEIRLVGPEHLSFLTDQGAFAALETRLTPELELEGIARDFNRQAQDQRKAIELNVADRIHVRYAASDRIAQAVDRHRDYLQEELLALSIERQEALRKGVSVKVGGEEVVLEIREG